ncbi:hypothetical protein OG905_38280 [Streptomyces sp. NBC_00322]|uniref:hypothetical protein n=1 Tax=Streptomyces sp. NBC_00322 TaxID=2975712 RepID=UPI002E2ACC94|nr:hypothetical protein [Streptomyces sp. NBC_00322]
MNAPKTVPSSASLHACHRAGGAVIAYGPDGNALPIVKTPSGSETEAIQVRFSTEPGRYLLAFDDD